MDVAYSTQQKKKEKCLKNTNKNAVVDPPLCYPLVEYDPCQS